MSKIILKNVRLSFPSLFNKAVFDNKETKFEATFLLHKENDKEQIKKLEAAVEAFAVETFGKGKVPNSLKRTCLTDGDTKDYDGYGNHIAFKGGSTRRITVLDRDKTPLVESDGKPYAGCYVNASVGLWYSDHPKGGKQILGNVMGVQFFKDGEAFGAGDNNAADDFDEFDDDDSEDMFD